jgi:hypothetical protein
LIYTVSPFAIVGDEESVESDCDIVRAPAGMDEQEMRIRIKTIQQKTGRENMRAIESILSCYDIHR